ncbi:MAG: hypothetical protein JRJ47_10570 [Deltaproteobacteria bacterium]|nr:hypothetical protein [Deltaproteobacteria bacterium]
MSDEDVELIVAFAEGRLSGGEERAVKKRLETEQRLRRTLADLVVGSRGTEYEKVLSQLGVEITDSKLRLYLAAFWKKPGIVFLWSMQHQRSVVFATLSVLFIAVAVSTFSLYTWTKKRVSVEMPIETVLQKDLDEKGSAKRRVEVGSEARGRVPVPSPETSPDAGSFDATNPFKRGFNGLAETERDEMMSEPPAQLQETKCGSRGSDGWDGVKEGSDARTELGQNGKTMPGALGFPSDTDGTSSEADGEDVEDTKRHIEDNDRIDAR